VTILEVTSREEMAQAIRQHAGTSCRIVWGSFSITFQELLESEKAAEQVLVRRDPNLLPTWEWVGSARARHFAKPTSRRRCPFAETIQEASKDWEKMPRKAWPKI